MHTRTLYIAFASVLCGTLAAGTAVATPVNYDDTIAGQDLTISRDGLSNTLFTFDAGLNVVHGRETFKNDPLELDVDGFRFQLLPNLRLDSIVLAFSFAGNPTPNNPNPNVYCQQWELRNAARQGLGVRTPDPLGTCNSFVDLQGNALYGPAIADGQSLFDNVLPLTGGIFELIGIGGQFGPGGGALDYTFAFNVRDPSTLPAVAEPAGAALLLTGLACLATLRRLSKQQR